MRRKDIPEHECLRCLDAVQAVAWHHFAQIVTAARQCVGDGQGRDSAGMFLQGRKQSIDHRAR